MQQPTKVFKPGRVCIILNGRMAGKKAIVLSAYDQGTRDRSFGHALVLGIENVPTAKAIKRCKRELGVKVFLKHVNYSHLMPTRYVVSGDIDPKTLVGSRTIETAEDKINAKKDIGKILLEKFTTPKPNERIPREVAFLAKKLRF